MFNLKNNTALVTGASQGIGAAIAKKLAHAGAHVICVSRTKEKIKNISRDINNNIGSSSFFPCDINQSSSIEKLIIDSLNKFKKIDILVNNAGISKDNLIMRMTEDQWDNVINTNLKSVFHLTKKVIRPMIKNKYGRIINISSIVGITGNIGQSNYAASKAGLMSFSQSIAKEVATRGITINCIAPGWIKTEMTNKLPEQVKVEFLNRIPMKKIGNPDDIANAVVFLASEEAQYITGQTITIDGGRTIN